MITGSRAQRRRVHARRTTTRNGGSRRLDHGFDELQHTIGNRAVGQLVQAKDDAPGAAPVKAPAKARSVYETPAAASSAMPESVMKVWKEHAADDPSAALAAVVGEMVKRGELDPRLLRTSGEPDLWSIKTLDHPGAGVAFLPAFSDPDNPAKKLPNPRFSVDPGVFAPDRSPRLLHLAILHEYRHVVQAYERVNAQSATVGERAPGYCNDPDEFDAYLAEVEAAYSPGGMLDAAIKAAVNWQELSDVQRRPFAGRWAAAAVRIKETLHYRVAQLLETEPAKAYRAECRRMEAAAREAARR